MRIAQVKQSLIDEYQWVLEETLRIFDSIICSNPPSKLVFRASKDEWSALDLLGHLRSCQNVWVFSVYTMLAADNPVLLDIHPRRWYKIMKYQELECDQLYAGFRIERLEFSRVLTSLRPEEWLRSSRIEGKTHSVYSQVRRMALHERGHWEQLENIFKR